MDINKALSYMFKDPTWLKKVFYLGLISLIPILGWIILYGWSIALVRQVIQGEDEPKLPEIDFKKQMEDGLNMFIAYLVYKGPVFILTILFFFLPFVGLTISNMDPGSTESGGILLTSMVVLLCGSVLITPLGFILSYVLPVIYTYIADTGSLRAAFDFKMIFRLIKAAPFSWFIVIAGNYLISTLASFGFFLFGIGFAFTNILGFMALLHFYGQAYREAKGKLALPAVL